ncbi:cytosolic carboxypeptidase 2 isoform X4 [Erythrolamprus reginae]|uniref:cytosolic carboxypeptidase 2 isoform X4 n=1 Tax=Erythrolamprus reginae TaxID=121349 RepID=UPI00396CDC65
MCSLDPEIQQFKDPYEQFMYHHLQYYGYFRDEENFPHKFSFPFESWESSCHLLTAGNFCKKDRKEHDSDKTLLCSLVMESALLKSKQRMLDQLESPSILRLREPRNLFSLPRGRNSKLTPLWPIECEVIEDHVYHIEWVPPEPEPFYQPTGNEFAPEIVGESSGTVVYFIEPAISGTYFIASRVGGSRQSIKSAAVNLKDPEDTVLLFESRFESGNLQKAVRVGEYEYELTLRTDLYTSKHTQWYYFRVQNTRKDVKYRFTIVNLMKAKSLYNMGMKPLMYSQKDAEAHGIGWRRMGNDIKYYKYNTEEGQTLYCLTWTVCFPNSYDTCYFAQFYPYTYSDLQNYLLTLVGNPLYSQYCKLRPLCSSLAGNIVYLLTITNPSKGTIAGAAKKAIILSARVHPGETNSSWVMRGFLDFIVSDAPDAHLLRDLFIFKVVPMLNPDGVIVGNYRCSLAGRDLNRNYRTELKESFPCIWYTRAMIKKVLEEREVLLYCDIHGHSRKNNIFMYGCNNKYAQNQLLHERIFPLMMSKNIPDKFCFNSCKFQVQKCKEGTGRVVMWRMGILNSYTMESTFSGSTLGAKSNCHFTFEDLKSLGYHVCDTLLDFCDPDRSKFQQCLLELTELLKQKIQTKLSELGKNNESTWSDISLSDVESSTSGSDSSQSDGPPAHLLKMAEKYFFWEDCNEKKKKKKKKLLRTRKERNDLHQKFVVSHALKQKEKVMGESSSNSQKCQEIPRGKQIVPLTECEFKIKNPSPLLISTIPLSPIQRHKFTTTTVKQLPSQFYVHSNGELNGKQDTGTTLPSPCPGVKRYRSLWWNPEVPSVTSMLRRSLSLKSQIILGNRPRWHLSQSRSQVLPHREFIWKPFQIDPILLRTENEYSCNTKGLHKAIGQKFSLPDSRETIQNMKCVY